MNENQNWYRQLLALVLLSASKGVIEYITNPDSREEAQKQIKDAFANIDYDGLANALSQLIENTADTSKQNLNEAIDTLRDRSLDAVDEAKSRAQDQLAPKKGGNKFRFFIGMLLGAVVAYFLLDEQRRDELLDRLTGASGPIEQTVQSYAQPVTNTAQQAVEQATESTSSGGGTGSTSGAASSPTSSTTGTGQ